ncbi:uncharacterized protein LOC121897638 isoform X1 [Thunnus maccoyii]|uniref:uncharacterized protein LOC121897638 isoform X1 n=2 Tax=Thunnus maccoyii TaxID=8240 RepID=UPI001C4D1EE2|nr:uncharacterized protein LOC121897638 isoform X1 [Thunnus maccoyii]
MLTATRNTFRRRRRAGPMTETPAPANRTSGVWRVKLFLLPNAHQVVLPPRKECSKLTRIGLGIPSHDLPGTVSHRSYVPLSWTLPEFNNYICQSFPTVSLNVIGFHLARADKSRVLTKIQANTLNELKTAAGRSRVYIIPQTNIILPLEFVLSIKTSGPERTHTLPETSPPAGPETVSQSLPASPSATPLMATPTASLTAITPAASPTAITPVASHTAITPAASHTAITPAASHTDFRAAASPTAVTPAASYTSPPAIHVSPSQSLAPSAARPPASTAVPQVTHPAPTAPMDMSLVTSNSNSHVSYQSPPLNTMSLSSTMDTDGSSPRTDLNPSLEASLDPAQWLNAGTPEVFYRRSRVEPLNRSPVSDFVIDHSEDEDGDKDDIIAVTFETDSPPSEEIDLAVILSTFQEHHLSEGLASTICIRRKKLLESAIKAISRASFYWTYSPVIEFVGEDADDMGGPQREFFRLLMIEVQTSLGIFEGKAGQVFLSYDQAALDQRKYFKGGNLIAWSIAHGGPCIKALDPSLFQLMCGQEPQLEQFDWQVLPDPDVQSKVKTILQCKTAGDLTALQQDLGDWIAECGVPGIFSATVEDIPKIYAYVVKHYIFLRTTKMICQFTEGMNAFGKLWDLVTENWIAFLPLFTNMQEPLSKAAFKAIFSYNYSSRGTNRRDAEEDTIYSWEMVLNMIEDKVTELRFEDLLIFITGADEVPALGFPRKPSIDFYEQEAGQRRLPYASTCVMCLYLPRGVTQEDELHGMLFQATRESLGFGKV